MLAGRVLISFKTSGTPGTARAGGASGRHHHLLFQIFPLNKTQHQRN